MVGIHRTLVFRASLAVVVILTTASVIFAQDEPVQIEFDAGELFNSANTWIDRLLPIFAVTIGLALAWTLLIFLSLKVVGAFGSDAKTVRTNQYKQYKKNRRRNSRIVGTRRR